MLWAKLTGFWGRDSASRRPKRVPKEEANEWWLELRKLEPCGMFSSDKARLYNLRQRRISQWVSYHRGSHTKYRREGSTFISRLWDGQRFKRVRSQWAWVGHLLLKVEGSDACGKLCPHWGVTMCWRFILEQKLVKTKHWILNEGPILWKVRAGLQLAMAALERKWPGLSEWIRLFVITWSFGRTCNRVRWR